jgi:plastocyanin
VILAACSSGQSPATAAASNPPTPSASLASAPAITALPISSATNIASPARSAPATPVPVMANVSMQHVAFAPPSLEVSAGTTVRWSNQDGIPHTVNADDNSFASGTIDSNKSYERTFAKPGAYAYHCSIHNDMKGKVVVK